MFLFLFLQDIAPVLSIILLSEWIIYYYQDLNTNYDGKMSQQGLGTGLM